MRRFGQSTIHPDLLNLISSVKIIINDDEFKKKKERHELGWLVEAKLLLNSKLEMNIVSLAPSYFNLLLVSFHSLFDLLWASTVLIFIDIDA